MITTPKTLFRSRLQNIRTRNRNTGPSVLEGAGLVNAITQLAEALNTTGTLHIDFIHCGCDDSNCLNEPDRLTVYEIIREQLNILLLNAQATRVAIHLAKNYEQLAIVIEDNVPGDINKQRADMSLQSIQNKIDGYQGRLNFHSAGEGGVLEILLNLTTGNRR